MSCLVRFGVHRITAVLSASTLACTSPIEGNWVSLQQLGNGAFNKLAAYGDTTTDATIYATTASDPNNWVKFYFEGDWEDLGDQWDFLFVCQRGPCSGDDFRMSCQIIDENNGEVYKLDCKANNKWKSYPFSWQEDI